MGPSALMAAKPWTDAASGRFASSRLRAWMELLDPPVMKTWWPFIGIEGEERERERERERGVWFAIAESFDEGLQKRTLRDSLIRVIIFTEIPLCDVVAVIRFCLPRPNPVIVPGLSQMYWPKD